MARLLSRRAFGVLAGTCSASCALFGGQTGQSREASGPPCEDEPVVAEETWNGYVVRDLVQALEGSHSANLHWRAEPNSAGMSTPVALDDRIVITLSYAGAAATRGCGGELDVPVEVTLSSEASGISEQGPGSLRFTKVSSPLTADLTYDSARLALAATLTMSAMQAVEPVGELEAQQDDLPGGSAQIGGEP